MPETLDDSLIDSLLGDIPLDASKSAGPEETAQINFWVPKSKKASYERLQKATGQKFGKRVRDIIVKAIERAEERAKTG